MSSLYLVMANTPIWVYVIFAALIYIAATSSGTRTVSLKFIIIVPAVFFALSVRFISGFYAVNHASPEFWFLGMAAGVVTGMIYARLASVSVNRELGIMVISRSPGTVMMMFIIFACRYASGFMQAKYPEIYTRDLFALPVSAVMGFCAGYIVGKTVMYLYRYKTHAHLEFVK